jgi:TetR/AcrR family transcriptional regulator, transcriptional repressor for nem operon
MPRPRGPARDLLLDAAQTLLLERGYEAAALDDVCTRAGVTKGALFYHFQSKEQLAAAAVERFYDQLVRTAQEAMGSPEDPAEVLWRYLDATVTLLRDPLLARGCLLGAMALETPQTHPAVAAAAQAALGRWRTTLVEVIGAAAHHHDVRVDADALADGLLAAVEGGLLLDHAKPTNPAAVAAVTHFRRYLQMTLSQGGQP